MYKNYSQSNGSISSSNRRGLCWLGGRGSVFIFTQTQKRHRTPKKPQILDFSPIRARPFLLRFSIYT